MTFIKKSFCKISKVKLKNKRYLFVQKPICFSCNGGAVLSEELCDRNADDTAVILFSGGTTGEPKGVMLSGRSLNTMAVQTACMSGFQIRGKSILAAMPVFHGFGLCVCIHAVLIHGGTCILVPKFSTKYYARLIKKYRPEFLAGVPTLFEALMNEPLMKKLDMSCLCGVFSGGDALPEKLKAEFEQYLNEHNSKVKIREGYGATECVTVSCLTPIKTQRRLSVGIPFPDTYYKICEIGTTKEVPYSTEGEICIHGPTLMKGYLHSIEETNNVLKYHEDGKIWLHTRDVGMMDEDGFVYFRRRLGRMIVTSGYNVYPERIESVLNAHPKVARSCVVGVDDPYKMQKIKAFVVPEKGVSADEKLKKELSLYCAKKFAKYSVPVEYEFVSAFPLTKFGKIDYCRLMNKKD